MNAFELPKMTIQPVYEYDKDAILREMYHSKTLIALYQAQNGDGRFLFTGTGEDEMALLIHLIHRHIEIYNLFETVMETIKKFRANEKDAIQFLAKASKYLYLKNKQH